jgi:hypothetical protein
VNRGLFAFFLPYRPLFPRRGRVIIEGMVDEKSPQLFLVEVLESLGFAERDALGLTNHDFGDIEVEWRGQRVTDGVTLQAFVSSYLWRLDTRLPTLVLLIEGLLVEGNVELWPGESHLLLAGLLLRLQGKAPRRHVDDAAFEERYGIHAASEQDARQALPEPLRRALLTAKVDTHVRLAPDHIALFPTSDSPHLPDRLEMARSTVHLAESIVAALPRRA